jgi:hypothetical protein
MGISGPTSRINKKRKINMLQKETKRNAAEGAELDLLPSIYKIQIRNEEKISDTDRIFCEEQQASLYRSLDEIGRWYNIFAGEAAKYTESHKVTYLANGKVKMHEAYRGYETVRTDYTDFEFKPFDDIDKLAEKNYNAILAFAKSIVAHFNNTYNVSAPYPEIDKEKLPVGFRPLYQSYVDQVIEHLGGRSFRDTAEDELIRRFLHAVSPGRWSKVKPELKKDKIVFPDVISFDSFWTEKNKLHYNYRKELEDLCAGIAFGADNTLHGGTSMIIRFDDDNVDISSPYTLSISNAEEMKFFKNGRIDVKFKDAKTADACFYKLKLDTLELRNDED